MPPEREQRGKLYRVVARRRGLGRVLSFDLDKGVGGGGIPDAKDEAAFTRAMKPSNFLSLAYQLVPRAESGYILKQLQKGRGEWSRPEQTWTYNPESPYWKKNTIINPMLWTRYSPDFDAHLVTGHEGRHRSLFLQKSGDPIIPVVIKPSERLREITGIKGFRRKPLVPQDLSSEYLGLKSLEERRPEVFTPQDRRRKQDLEQQISDYVTRVRVKTEPQE